VKKASLKVSSATLAAMKAEKARTEKPAPPVPGPTPKTTPAADPSVQLAAEASAKAATSTAESSRQLLRTVEALQEAILSMQTKEIRRPVRMKIRRDADNFIQSVDIVPINDA